MDSGRAGGLATAQEGVGGGEIGGLHLGMRWERMRGARQEERRGRGQLGPTMEG